jgi:hypothetical protein
MGNTQEAAGLANSTASPLLTAFCSRKIPLPAGSVNRIQTPDK